RPDRAGGGLRARPPGRPAGRGRRHHAGRKLAGHERGRTAGARTRQAGACEQCRQPVGGSAPHQDRRRHFRLRPAASRSPPARVVRRVSLMKIVIPDDYQDMVDQLECFSLIRHHDVIRYREPARDLTQLVERLCDADVVVAIRERVEFSRALLERLPKLKLIALVGRNSKMIDFAACTELGIAVATGKSNSPVAPADYGIPPSAPAERALVLTVPSRRNVALEAERMKRGEWPCTLSHRLRGSTLGIFGLGAIGQLVAQGGRGLGMDVLVWGRKSSL